MTDPTKAAVVELCVRLEGLPLAIELAAARTRLLTPGAMLDRLDRRLDLLAAGPRDAPGRHRALRLTLEWSFDLLTPEQQRVFARLGVFVGSWSIDAAEAVCGASVLDDLSAVAEESLIRREPGEDARFGMLETVREYAVERLQLLGEEEDARERHARYFLAFAEEAHTAHGGPEQADSLARLEREHDNLRAAQAYIREQGDADLRLRVCAALWRWGQLRGRSDRPRESRTARARPGRPSPGGWAARGEREARDRSGRRPRPLLGDARACGGATRERRNRRRSGPARAESRARATAWRA